MPLYSKHLFHLKLTMSAPEAKRPKLADKANVLMVGTGEYTTGYVGGTAADSDKGAGVVALTMFDLRRRGKVERVGMCGVNVSCLAVYCDFFFYVPRHNLSVNTLFSYL